MKTDIATDRMSPEAKVVLLAKIAHWLTVCARSTYEAGSDDVLDPELLRAYNELQHRITGSLRDHILNIEGIPLNTIIEMMRGFGKERNREREIEWALVQAVEGGAESEMQH